MENAFRSHFCLSVFQVISARLLGEEPDFKEVGLHVTDAR